MTITAFLIDPEKREISRLENFDGSLESLYKEMDCNLVSIFYHDNHGFYYDDDHDPEYSQYFWRLPEFNNWVAGKSIVVAEATTKDGDNLSADEAYFSILRKKIRFGINLENEAA